VAIDINDILDMMVKKQASDLFITAGMPPSIKIDGRISPISRTRLNEQQSRDLTCTLMTPEQREVFFASKEGNFAVVRRAGRFRISAFMQRDAVGMVLRRVQTHIPTFEQLNLPPVLTGLATAGRGIVIFVGGAGTGKSSTLAAMVGYLNRNSTGHIISIEDPIEFLHKHKHCIVTQREVGIDTESYEVALSNALRQTPDVILIGEIRTREVMEYAMAFANTGHLVLTTLHANNVPHALERITHFFPKDNRDHVLMDISLALKGIVAQQLLPRADGKGLQVAVEVLLNTPLTTDLIARGEIHKLKGLMKRSTEQGMITFEQALYEAYRRGDITQRDALHYADSANEVRLMIKFGEAGAAGEDMRSDPDTRFDPDTVELVDQNIR